MIVFVYKKKNLFIKSTGYSVDMYHIVTGSTLELCITLQLTLLGKQFISRQFLPVEKFYQWKIISKYLAPYKQMSPRIYCRTFNVLILASAPSSDHTEKSKKLRFL